ncbi:hypothetical protein CRV15_35270 (plasmid) [Streptomyces clavuligerus]|uniref:Uncharacterized protein n=1 Tax=Streptomyces clavuligerus TaxID=1901 RepID=B5GLU6_STRCL|nr:hypothetical protein SSCG_00320 [Streptomyces clavuligerus]EFG04954.1 Hypothetical protein SCLAV_p1472 [Streptomyces clavuligerus]QCS10779.1 hypothetical protein CRV15_35270 [Streptomyces clavuligerus]QPJ97187.1 hypothetical protein GE265_29215 [Streptomyces clavuligerus]
MLDVVTADVSGPGTPHRGPSGGRARRRCGPGGVRRPTAGASAVSAVFGGVARLTRPTAPMSWLVPVALRDRSGDPPARQRAARSRPPAAPARSPVSAGSHCRSRP